jgi:5-formyltetrahydrofolate cyclo-ligase
MEEEVNTYPLIERAWQDGKTVAVPIAKVRGEMYFVSIVSFSELKKSRFGVMEPQKGKTEEVVPKKKDFFLVPGSVFDQKGNRYGYGGGYYDRYFQQYPNVYKIAAAFSFQVMEFDLQVEVFDIPVDCIVTEKGVIGGSNDEYFD